VVIFDDYNSNLSSLDHVREIRRGYPITLVAEIRARLGLTESELANLLGISIRTYHLRKSTGHMSKRESERLYRFCYLLNLAKHALESKEHAQIWLRTLKKALNGETPYQFCDTSPGYQEVINLLGRVEYGVFS